MSKKIALISPHHEPNFGTMLQAFALAQAIKNIGYSSEYVSYNNFIKRSFIEKVIYYLSHPKEVVSRFTKRKTKSNIDDYSFFETDDFKATMDEFEHFYKKYIPFSLKKYNPNTIHSITGYSKYIVGSDQTWSPFLYNPSSINFLDFVKDDSLKNAYAPSLGTLNIPKSFHSIIKEKLTNFANLSCREKTNCNLIEGLTGKKVTHVLDPTLLLTPEQWNIVAKDVSHMPEKYILCYILGVKKCISDFAENLGEKKDIPVYYVATRPTYLQKENTLKGIGPSKFISLIKGAAYVVTDSFHGTLFSINYNCNFYCFDKREENGVRNDNGRIMEVLKDFELTNRFKSDGDRKFEEDILFDKISPFLEKCRTESLNYLKKILD